MRRPVPNPTLPLAAGPAPRSDDRGAARGAGAPRAATLRALACAHEVLLAPHAFADDVAWRARVAAEVGALFGADHVLVLLPGARRPYVGAGFDPAALDALAAFHPVLALPASSSTAAEPSALGRRVTYRDPALARLHARRLAVADPVFTRRGNEAAMGRSVDGTAMFDAVCRPMGVADFHGVFARTPAGDAMLFVAHGRRVGRGTRVGEAAVPLLRILAPAVGAVPHLAARAWAAAPATSPTNAADRPAAAPLPAAALPGAAALRAQFGLTPREADVARGLAQGWTRQQIAAVYSVSGATVRHHTEAVFRKLGVARRAAVALALLAGPRRGT